MSAADLIALNCEVMLAGWSETSTGGRKCTFWLPEDESPEHPMKQFTTRRSGHAGSRFMMTLVELGPDEAPIDQRAREAAETAKGGPVSKHAGRLCRDPEFQAYVAQRYPRSNERWTDEGCRPEQIAANLVRQICAINSRAELDVNTDAERTYNEKVLGSFIRWRDDDDSGTDDNDERFDQQGTGEGFDGR